MTRFLKLQEVIDIHHEIITAFGGCPGVLDLGLLASAVEMPKAQMGREFLHPTVFDQAAAYLFHICKNHAFIDGNKRTAALAALIFLEDNQIFLDIDELLFEELIVDTAQGKVDKKQISLFFQNSK